VADKPAKLEKHYLAFLLRLWWENGGDSPHWRASLERPRSGERLGFASLASLFAFLENEARLHSPDLACSDEGSNDWSQSSGQRGWRYGSYSGDPATYRDEQLL